MRILAGLILGLVLAGPVLALTELVLQDGRVLESVDVRRDGDLYLLEQESGDVITIPVQLVREVRLKQDPPKPDPRTGITYRKDGNKTLAGSSKRPEGVVTGGSETLAGQESRPPTRSEQLGVFGEPAKFSKDIIDPSWTPSSDWENDPEKNNNFNPSTWSKSVIDSDWEPTSSFKEGDVLESGHSEFQKGTIDNEWKPQDGFKKR